MSFAIIYYGTRLSSIYMVDTNNTVRMSYLRESKGYRKHQHLGFRHISIDASI